MTGRQSERMMVSCQPLGGLLEEVERRGGDPNDLVGHLGRPVTDLGGRRNRIPWDDFRSVLERLGEHYDDDEIVDIGRCLADTTAQRPFLLIAKRFLSVGDFYRAVFSPKSGWGQPMFPCMDSTFAQLDDGFFELGLAMQEGVAGSLPFMLITQGNIIGMAEVMGGAPPEIRAELTERSARFDVRVEPTLSRFARARRRLTLPLRANEMAAELQDAHTSLRARYDALTEALEERENTTEALRRSQTNLRLALESVEMTLWDLDLRDNVLTVDGIGHQLIASDDDGASPGLELFLPLVVEEDRDAVADAVRASIRTSTPWEQQFRVKRDGEVRILEARAQVLSDESGEATRFVGVTNDVTEELRRTERDMHLGQVVAGSPLEIYVVDPETFRFIRANAVACERLGYTEDEIRGMSVDQIIDTDDEKTEAAFESVKQEQTDRLLGTVRHRRKDGSSYPLEVRVQPSTFDGRPALIAIALDVTERVEAEQARRDLEAQLWQAQKLDALGTLASGIAHDFNNLLMAIRVSTELATAEIGDDSPIGAHLARIVRATDHGKMLARQILTFSREDERERVLTEIGPIVEDAVELLRAALPSTIRLRAQIATEGCEVLADGSQIGQVITNLCSNAAQATNMHGTVQLRLGPHDLGPADAAQFPNLAPGPYVQITVEDDGVGIPPELVDRIFDPFFTTQDHDSGDGLGLAVVHGVARAHGGAVSVQSEEGVGTTMRVLLPLAERNEVEPAIDLVRSQLGGRLLLVDDSEAISDVLAIGLQEMGFDVFAFSSSADAAQSLGAAPESFDLVITDQTMPGMSGLELARRVRDVRADLPVILISGLDAPFDNSVQMRQGGVSAVLSKPFGLEELGATIERLLTDEVSRRSVSGS